MVSQLTQECNKRYHVLIEETFKWTIWGYLKILCLEEDKLWSEVKVWILHISFIASSELPYSIKRSTNIKLNGFFLLLIILKFPLMSLVDLLLLVCVCWTGSRGSSLSPCPSGRYSPTSPCSSDLMGRMFSMCSSCDLYLPVEKEDKMHHNARACIWVSIERVKEHSARKVI